nr:dihydroorotate dehydrogenase-like protein [Aestuariimicrobium sp. p3-SID1156]
MSEQEQYAKTAQQQAELSRRAPNARELASQGPGLDNYEAVMAAAASAATMAKRAPLTYLTPEPQGPAAELNDVAETGASPSLATRYLGLDLRSPLVASAGPLSQSVEGIKELADTGLGAVVMYSLFEEQIRRQEARQVALLERHEEAFAEALNYFPEPEELGSQDIIRNYLQLVEDAAKAIDIPLIASLNGATHGGWVDTARQLQDAGAAALELNIYMVPGDLGVTGAEVEERHLEILAGVKQAVDIPVAVKLSPYFSSVGQMAIALDEAGADGLVLFNRFLQPDIDIERLEVVPGVELSTPFEARLPRTWIAVLHGKLRASLAGTSGVETVDDVVKYLLAGADVVMTTSALVRHGRGYASTLVDGLGQWLSRKDLTLDRVRGMLAVPEEARASGYERAGYVAALQRAKTRYGA